MALSQETDKLYSDISIEMSLEEIPETIPCLVCNITARRTFISFERPYRISGQPAVVRCDLVPGYRCGECEVEWYDLGASVRILTKTLEVVSVAHDTVATEQVAASLRVGQELLTRFNSPQIL